MYFQINNNIEISMVSKLLLKKQQGISVKLARIIIYLNCKMKKRQSDNCIKHYRKNGFIIYNQTTHRILVFCCCF